MNIDRNTLTELVNEAQKNQICTPWLMELKQTTDADKLADMYIKGIDFCIANGYPTNEFIRRHFPDAGKKGIFVDAVVTGSNRRHTVVLGESKGELDYSGFSVARIYVKDDSELVVNAEDKAFVIIDAFDSACVCIHARGHARVRVNRYGDAMIETDYSGEAEITINEKQKNTY